MAGSNLKKAVKIPWTWPGLIMLFYAVFDFVLLGDIYGSLVLSLAPIYLIIVCMGMFMHGFFRGGDE